MTNIRCVYVLRSVGSPDRHYVGLSADLKGRLAEHNSGKARHTPKHAPWKLVAAIWLEDEVRAHAFERYLKTGSRRAFASRHLR
jgi:putative endonuclease